MSKKTICLFAIIVYLSNTAITTTAFCQQSPVEKFLLQLHEKKFRWMIEKKNDSLSSMLDERLLYIHSSGWT